MFTFGILIGFAGLLIAVYRLFDKVNALSARVAFLEDRSPQAEYIRSLENKEKGWE